VVWLCHDDGSKFFPSFDFISRFNSLSLTFRLCARRVTAKVMIHKEQARRGSGPCSAVKWIRESGQLYLLTAFSTGKIASFALSSGAMRKISAVSIGVAASNIFVLVLIIWLYRVCSHRLPYLVRTIGEVHCILRRHSSLRLF
jgi:hypothetical protein